MVPRICFEKYVRTNNNATSVHLAIRVLDEDHAIVGGVVVVSMESESHYGVAGASGWQT